ncbi:MAG TPA: hypothetical protein VKU19_15150 [Bryobacteraceae bacterium]|nr:hypothetical protein [Bryobacteraceae bacterium]
MLSVKLVQLVEDHWEQISERILHKIQNDPRLIHVSRLSELELRERTREIVKNIGDWLGASLDEPFARRCEVLGQHRFEEGIPLHEVVLARFIIKEGLLEFVRDHAFVETSLQLYAEGELEKSVGHLFDRMIYYVVRGYEEAMREGHQYAGAASAHRRSH